jgi:hypothetical protein
MFEVYVNDDYMMDGIGIWITTRFEDRTGQASGFRQILHLGDSGSRTWSDIEPLTQVEPTLKLEGEAARALLDALLRHYQGSEDLHTTRADLLHERGRVDKFISALLRRPEE